MFANAFFNFFNSEYLSHLVVRTQIIFNGSDVFSFWDGENIELIV